MANTLASALIDRALDNASRIGTGQTRSGSTMTTKGIEWLNSIMYMMARKRDFIECKVTSSSVAGTSITVASTQAYTFPTGWKSIYDIILINGTNSRKLAMKLRPKYVRETPYPAGDSTGTPVFYSPYDNTFDVNPIPDAAYVMPIHYSIWPTTITATTDTVIYTPDKDDIVVAGMTYKLFMYLQQYTDALAWKAEFTALLNDAVSDDESLPDWSPVAEAFNAGGGNVITGDYWNNPWCKSIP